MEGWKRVCVHTHDTGERAQEEGMRLRWKDGKGELDVIHGIREGTRRGYVVEVEGWTRVKGRLL